MRDVQGIPPEFVQYHLNSNLDINTFEAEEKIFWSQEKPYRYLDGNHKNNNLHNLSHKCYLKWTI